MYTHTLQPCTQTHVHACMHTQPCTHTTAMHTRAHIPHPCTHPTHLPQPFTHTPNTHSTHGHTPPGACGKPAGRKGMRSVDSTLPNLRTLGSEGVPFRMQGHLGEAANLLATQGLRTWVPKVPGSPLSSVCWASWWGGVVGRGAFRRLGLSPLLHPPGCGRIKGAGEHEALCKLQGALCKC